MRHAVTLLAGEAGDTTTHLDYVLRTVEATGVEIDWHRHWLDNHTLTDALIKDGRKTGNVLMPFLHGLRDEGKPAPIVQARRAFGVFVNMRPARSLPAVSERFEGVDLIVVRETTEDVYTSMEHESLTGIFESLKVTTATACEKIARYAFEKARAEGRKKVTIAHKANIMKKSDGLFLSTAQRIAEEYPDIEAEDRIVDALCMQLTMWPERFDVLLCANLFGDIVDDLCAGLVGGLANCPSINIGEDNVRIYTVGSGTSLAEANSDAGNPMSLLLAAVHMLDNLGEEEASDRLEGAIIACLEAGTLPVAVGGEATLHGFCDAVIAAIRA